MSQPPIALQDLHRCFRSTLRGFRRAEAACGRCTRFFCVGGRRVEIRSAGPDPLATTTAALEHLSVPAAGRADVTICAWAGKQAELAQTAAWLPPGIYVAPQSGLQATMTASPASFVGYVPRFRLGMVWLADTPTHYAFASPLRELFAAALRPFGLVGLHAAVVGNAEGGALLAGAGGAGKSTSALACALAGMHFVAEDFCLVRPAPAPVAYGIYNSARLSAKSRAWLAPPNAADTGHWVEDKRLYLLHRAPAIKLVDQLPIKTVLVLRITGERHSRLRPATRMAALNALAPTSVRLMGLPAHAAPAVFHGAASLVRQVGCYHLELGADLAALPSLVQAAIDGDVMHA